MRWKIENAPTRQPTMFSNLQSLFFSSFYFVKVECLHVAKSKISVQIDCAEGLLGRVIHAISRSAALDPPQLHLRSAIWDRIKKCS